MNWKASKTLLSNSKMSLEIRGYLILECGLRLRKKEKKPPRPRSYSRITARKL